MRSVSELNGQYFDSRKLILQGTYFSLSEEDVDKLVKRIYMFLNVLLNINTTEIYVTHRSPDIYSIKNSKQ